MDWRSWKMNDESRYDELYGDEDDLANEEYERQRKKLEDEGEDW